MLRWSSISVVFISIWLRFTRLLLIWICQLLEFLLQMFRLIILLPTRIRRIDLSLLSVCTKTLIVTTNSNGWTTVTWPAGLIESYAFLFYHLWWLLLILNVQILALLWILSFLTIADVLLKHIVNISHVIVVDLLVISSHLIPQSTKTKRSRRMWSGTLLLMHAVVSDGIRPLGWWLDR